ncbi:MAG: hypothetical protein HYT80_06000 [Euryarchaeota archaeon]|nr:hypothetical protein [Euryarchaeota archaeon]
MSAASEEVPRQRIPRLRIVVATSLAIVVLAGSLGYHDAAFDVDDLAEATTPGTYRFKGEIQPWEGEPRGFVLVDPSARKNVEWNLTTPEPGHRYVVEAEFTEAGSLRALAVSPVYAFQGRWF